MNTSLTKLSASIRLALQNSIIAVAKAVLLASCTSAPTTYVHDTVGSALTAANETGRTTALHLERERDWQEASALGLSSDLVRLANGQPIGFRARHTELPHGSSVAVAQSR